MRRILLFLTILCMMFGGIPINAQKAKYYVHIPNKKDVPFAIKTLGKNDNLVVLQSNKNHTLAQSLNQYNVTEFRQAFPDAVTDWLREVYYVECDSINIQTNISLTKMIALQSKHQIPLVVKLLREPTPTGEIYTPNDPKYNSDERHRAHLKLIHAPETWEIVRRYPKIDVAVHDCYFAQNEDLSYKRIIENNHQPGDNGVHGAFVAGCLGATTNNNKGIASLGGLNTNLIISTKRWARDDEVLQLAKSGYRVINCSWVNSSFPDPVTEALYKEIRDVYNTVVVCGAGNGYETHGLNPSVKYYPASYPTVLSVTSVGHKYNIGHQGNSNWKDVHDRIIGSELKTHQHNDAVDICAPGYEVLSTMGSGYSESNGTSFAAPQVATTAALVMVVNPSLTAKQVIDIIKSTADASIYNIPQNRKYIGKLGTGRLDAYAAVKKACSVDLNNKTFSNEAYSGCIINIKNSKIPANRTLTLNITKEVNFEGTFAIDHGGKLDIKYTGL